MRGHNHNIGIIPQHSLESTVAGVGTRGVHFRIWQANQANEQRSRRTIMEKRCLRLLYVVLGANLVLETFRGWKVGGRHVRKIDLLGLGRGGLDKSSSSSSLERTNVVELSQRMDQVVEDNSENDTNSQPITAAICHKTLFGDGIDMNVIMRWAAYNRILGFDHIFIWYMPGMVNTPGFEALQQLNYVTMVENPDAKLSWYEPKQYWELLGSNGERDGPGGQQAIEMDCINRVASNYTWVLNLDADEFFWHHKHMGIKEFLSDNENFYYLSVGKQMYSLNYAVESNEETSPDTGFGLDRYAFTHPGYYCVKDDWKSKKLGSDYCPMWQGSSKIFVRPDKFKAKHKLLETHGVSYDLRPRRGQKQLLAGETKFMEFPFIFSEHNVTTVASGDTVQVWSGDEASFSYFDRAYIRNDDGSMTLTYSSDPIDMFRYVVSRAESVMRG